MSSVTTVSPTSVPAGAPATVRRGPLPPATPLVLGPLFWAAGHLPAATRFFQPLAAWVIPLVSSGVRNQTRRNSARIFGRTLAPKEQRVFTRRVARNFYGFVTDISQCCREGPEHALARIVAIEGQAEYKAARASRRGAILVTAHMGSFEVGLAALKQTERRVHVVFKRDASGPFESMRSRLRRMLGVLEAPVDDGMATWMNLRDALLNDDVVVMQGDRAMPSQRSEVVPFLHGHLRLPTGPVRLARLTGSPIVPVFTIRLETGRFAVHLLPPIYADSSPPAVHGVDPAMAAIGQAIESMVARYPDQWLVFESAFEEDRVHA